ncbi:MAG: hypothetical protein QOC96_2972 [Acidobacteriota bacterium]|nr:hypothetical protein [Acidobacteriota bacterium]
MEEEQIPGLHFCIFNFAFSCVLCGKIILHRALKHNYHCNG